MGITYEQLVEGMAEVDRLYSAGDPYHAVLRGQLESSWQQTLNAPSGGGASYVASTPPPPPAPILPNFKSLSTSTLAIKQAPIDTIVFNNDLISNENMVELLYEDIAGLELANISREDLINGQDVVYSPIANLSSIYKLFNPNNIIAAPSTLTSYFSRFAIDIILRGMNEPYLDENTGDLVIEIDTILDEEEIHTQITSSGTIELVEL